MFRMFSGVIAVLGATGAYAQSVSDAELATAKAVCEKHWNSSVPPPQTSADPPLNYRWDPGYESCGAIISEWQARQNAGRDNGAAIDALAKRLAPPQ